MEASHHRKKKTIRFSWENPWVFHVFFPFQTSMVLYFLCFIWDLYDKNINSSLFRSATTPSITKHPRLDPFTSLPLLRVASDGSSAMRQTAAALMLKGRTYEVKGHLAEVNADGCWDNRAGQKYRVPKKGRKTMKNCGPQGFSF